MSAEVWLVVVALGFYLWDGCLLLTADEGLLTPDGAGWRVILGHPDLRLGRRHLVILGPLSFLRPVYRLGWDLAGAGTKAGEERECPPPPLPTMPVTAGLALKLPLVMLALGLYLLLPLGLFTALGSWGLGLALGFIYVSLVALLVWLWRQRLALGLSPRTCLGWALEYLCCPPFALNLWRRLSLAQSVAQPVAADLMVAAQTWQTPAQWAATRAVWLARLEELLLILDPASPDYARYAACAGRLRAASGVIEG